MKSEVGPLAICDNGAPNNSNYAETQMHISVIIRQYKHRWVYLDVSIRYLARLKSEIS